MDEWLPDEFTTALDEVRTLGDRALVAAAPDRADLYARVLTTCAACHARWMEYGL